MTTKEAEKIFKEWQEYQEINDKLQKILSPSIPRSFLPYPSEVLEEALNMIAKRYFDAGDKEGSEFIQRSMGSLMSYKKDEEAVEGLIKRFNMLKDHADLKDISIANLRKSRDSWAKFKNDGVR
jgi:hypothetical protein